jgi:t-SNARE complex subunit (syntaxin)
MSDEELCKRLRDEHLAMTRNEAAAAIEALTAKLAKMVEERDTLRLVIDANIEKHRSRAEAAEAKLAKAVEALREIADAFGCECGDAARATLAEIEGEKP